jgi:hypothetical protein
MEDWLRETLAAIWYGSMRNLAKGLHIKASQAGAAEYHRELLCPVHVNSHQASGVRSLSRGIGYIPKLHRVQDANYSFR